MRKHAKIICSLALFVAPVAGAAEAPSWKSIIPADVPTTRHDLPVSELTIGHVARILMQKTKLTDLYKRRIIPEIRHVGDAGNSVSWGCLAVATTDGLVVIHPDGGEMGADDVIIGIDVERAPKDWPSNGTDECPTRTGIDEAAVIMLDDGLRFGSSKVVVMSTLGRPSLARDDLLAYHSSAPIPHCPKCEGTESDLAFRFGHGTMSALEIRQISVGE